LQNKHETIQRKDAEIFSQYLGVLDGSTALTIAIANPLPQQWRQLTLETKQNPG